MTHVSGEVAAPGTVSSAAFVDVHEGDRFHGFKPGGTWTRPRQVVLIGRHAETCQLVVWHDTIARQALYAVLAEGELWLQAAKMPFQPILRGERKTGPFRVRPDDDVFFGITARFRVAVDDEEPYSPSSAPNS